MALDKISRRGFVAGGLAAFSSLMLPCIEGDRFSILPIGTRKAQADEGDSSEADIMVVSRTQIGVVCYDVTDTENLKPIPNAQVKITSRFNQKVLEGTADAQGKIIFDIRELADGSNEDIPSFNGSIEVTCDGYRDVIIPLTRIIAHTSVVAPTRPVRNKPYFRTLTMNEWDIQYTEQVFIRSSESDGTHTIEGEVWLPSEKATPSATLVYVKDGHETEVGNFELVEQKGNIAKMRITGQYLLEGGKQCLSEADEVHVHFELSNANTELWMQAGLTSEPAPILGNVKDSSGNKFVIPSTMGQSLSAITMPDSFVMPFANAKITLWQPRSPFLYDFSPFGYGMLGFNFSDVSSRDDKGNFFKESGWKDVPRKSVEGECEAEFDKQVKVWDKYKENKAIIDDKDNKKKWTHEFSAFWKFVVNAQLYGLAKYSYKKEQWALSINALLAARLDIYWTWDLNIGGFPLYFIINPWANFAASFRFGATTRNIFDFEDYEADELTLGNGLTVGINGTVGVGLNNLLSVSFTGGGYLSFYCNYAPNPGHFWPRIWFGYGYSSCFTLQASFIKITLPMWNLDKPDAYDSNTSHLQSGSDSDEAISLEAPQVLEKSKLDSVLQQRLGNMGMSNGVPTFSSFPSFEEILKYSKVVTNADLHNSKEFEATAALKSATNPYKVEVGEGDGEEFPDITIVPVASTDTGSVTAASNGEVADGSGAAGEVSNAAGSTGAATGAAAKAAAGAGSVADEGKGDLINDGHESDSLDYLPTYKYVGNIDSVNLQGKLGVSGVADGFRGGIKPQIDNVILSDVNSNPCMKLLVTKNQEMMVLFRIVSADIGNGQMRQRLAYHLMEGGAWSRPYVVNFDPQAKNIAREDMYDFDFDVTQATGPGGVNYISVLLTSGTRPDGDSTSISEGMRAKCISLVTLYDSYATSGEDRLKAIASMTSCIHELSEGGNYTLTTPAITGFNDEFAYANTMDYCVMGTYMRNTFSETEGIESGGLGIGFFARWEEDANTHENVFTITRVRMGQAGGGFISWPVKIDDDSYSYEYGSVANVRRANFAAYDGEYSSIFKLEGTYKNHDASQFSSFGSTELATFGGKSGNVARKLYPWGNQGEMLATVKSESDEGQEISVLYHIAFDEKNGGKPTFTQVGPKEGLNADFVVDGGGHYLFFAQNTDGKVGQEYDENGPTGNGVTEHRHTIMAIAQVDDLFTQPFVFAEVNHFVDDLVASTVSDGYVTFMVSSIKDIDNSLADIYDVRVPLTKALNPVALTCKEPFALSGEECPFQVDVRNDGNLVVTAANFTLYDVETGDQVGETQHVDFANANACRYDQSTGTATYNTDGFSSSQKGSLLVANDGEGVVLPGQTVAVEVKFAIPEEWHDAKKVCVVLDDVEVINPSGLLGANFYSLQLGESEVPSTELGVETVSANKDVLSGEVHESSKDSGKKTDGHDKNADGHDDEDGDTPSVDGKSKKNLARTADDLGMLTPAAMAVAAAGAGMAAYSRRRTKIARGDYDEE